jgi:hypothetical protein
VANESGDFRTEQQAPGPRIMFLVLAAFVCFAVLFLLFVVLPGAEWADDIMSFRGLRMRAE